MASSPSRTRDVSCRLSPRDPLGLPYSRLCPRRGWHMGSSPASAPSRLRRRQALRAQAPGVLHGSRAGPCSPGSQGGPFTLLALEWGEGKGRRDPGSSAHSNRVGGSPVWARVGRGTGTVNKAVPRPSLTAPTSTTSLSINSSPSRDPPEALHGTPTRFLFQPNPPEVSQDSHGPFLPAPAPEFLPADPHPLPPPNLGSSFYSSLRSII